MQKTCPERKRSQNPFSHIPLLQLKRYKKFFGKYMSADIKAYVRQQFKTNKR